MECRLTYKMEKHENVTTISRMRHFTGSGADSIELAMATGRG